MGLLGLHPEISSSRRRSLQTCVRNSGHCGSLHSLQQRFWECILEKGVLNRGVGVGGAGVPVQQGIGLWGDLPGIPELVFQERYLNCGALWSCLPSVWGLLVTSDTRDGLLSPRTLTWPTSPQHSSSGLVGEGRVRLSIHRNLGSGPYPVWVSLG